MFEAEFINNVSEILHLSRQTRQRINVNIKQMHRKSMVLTLPSKLDDWKIEILDELIKYKDIESKTFDFTGVQHLWYCLSV